MLFISPFASGQFKSTENNSLIIQYSSGEIIHYQISDSGVRKIWTQTSDIGYSISKVVDLNHDGKLEVLLVSAQEGLLLLDLATGKEKWNFPYSANQYNIANVAVGDLTGDGNDEIVVGRFSTQPNFFTDVFNWKGERISQIPFPVKSTTYYGVDRVGIFDLDQNGDNELIISFGAVFWNYDNGTGSFEVDRYDWNPDTNKFDNTFSVEGPDTGGNTQLLLSSNEIYTSGWYNNPIRRYDAICNEKWSETLFNTTSDKPLEIADTVMSFIEDSTNQHAVMAFSQNYWSNYTMKYQVMNPQTGQLIASQELFNYSSVNLAERGGHVFASLLKNAGSGEQRTSYLNVREYSMSGGQITETQWNNDQNQWKYLLRDFIKLLMVTVDGNYYVIGTDNTGNALLSADNRRLDFPVPLEGVVSATAKVVDQTYEGTTIITYDLGPQYSELAIVIVSIILGLILLYYGFSKYKDRRFDLSFGSNWKELFQLKIEQVVGHIRQNLTTTALPAKFKQTPKDTTSHIPPLTINTQQSEKSDRPPTNLKLTLTNNSKISIFELLNTNTNIAKQVKIGDMGILIEIFSNYPESTEIVDIIPKFNFASKSTIYSRIDKLVEFELLENLEESEVFLKNKTKSVKITETGIQLLAILYNSFEI